MPGGKKECTEGDCREMGLAQLFVQEGVVSKAAGLLLAPPNSAKR